MLPTQMIRNAGALLAMLFGMMALVVSPVGAQESTPVVEQPVTIGETEVTWDGEWQYDAAGSVEQQLSLNKVDLATATISIAMYGEFAQEEASDPEELAEVYSGGIVQGMEEQGAQGLRATGAGDLENGAWRSYSFNLLGFELGMLVTATEDSDGGYVVSTLVGNADSFQDSITQAQDEIMLDGEPTFLAGVDAAEIATGIATPIASPETEATPSS